VSTIEPFRGKHAGETLLLVGNGPNLSLTPPETFPYPAIGMNTIHLYDGWIPDYYVAVDRRVKNEFGAAIDVKFADIPKFVPSPKLLRWRGPNFYRFKNRPGPLYGLRDGKLWQDDIGRAEVTWITVMHVAIKIAYFMGAGTILMIGVQHKKRAARAHFWGSDKGMPVDMPLPAIFDGYRQLTEELESRGVKLLNISQDTHVPGKIIPQDDWENWVSKPDDEE